MQSPVRALHCVCVCLGAYLGVALRVGLSGLSTWPVSYLHHNANSSSLGHHQWHNTPSILHQLGAGFFLPNILGSFVMGIVSAISWQHRLWPFVKSSVGTGLCGSCTTFATWQLMLCVQLWHWHWLRALVQALCTICTSYGSFLLGRHLGLLSPVCCPPVLDKDTIKNENLFLNSKKEDQENGGTPKSELENDQNENESTTDSYRKSLPPTITVKESPTIQQDLPLSVLVCLPVLFVSLTLGVWCSALILPNKHWVKGMCVAMCFGPFGAVTRYLLSIRNVLHPDLPRYTLLANVLASVLNVCIMLVYVYHSEQRAWWLSEWQLWVQVGVSTGGMGSLSTVSTWISELYTLSAPKALVYGLVSLLLTQTLCSFIVAIFLTYKFSVAMTCEGCANQARKVLGKLGDQVEIVCINVEQKTVEVKSSLPQDQVLSQLQKMGKECKPL